MCGLTGFLNFAATTSEADLRATASAMADTLRRRGPDADGVWADAEAGVALGHRRLSIIELSEAGAQPMVSASGRFVVSYNGEIYNFAQLRAELAEGGRTFRGNSDTEVLVEACEVWGVENAVKRLVGMFAFALWDCRDRRLILVRDRLGIKPLYWGKIDKTLFFGSQTNSFACHPAWTGRIDQDALAAYFRFGYVPTQLSIYQGIEQVGPGEMVAIEQSGRTVKSRYWDTAEIARSGLSQRTNPSDDDAIEELENLLRDAVGSRMIADVPLGAFLSGGIDSSTVVAMMQELSPTPIRTFSIGFPEDKFNEATYAKDVALHLGTNHEELYVDWKTALDVVPRLPEWYDEPFADSSQIPTFLVSQMARKSVKTVLSGDGGDEVFAGYSRYFLGNALWQRFGAMPATLRNLGGTLIRAVPARSWDNLATLLPARRRPPHVGYRAHKLAAMLRQPNAASFYRLLVSQWSEPGQILRSKCADSTAEWEQIVSGIDDPTERMQLLDMMTYLPGDILTKVDRASMAVSLEARVPLLDHRIIEFASRLPMRFKIRGGESKWLLRQVLYRRVPRALIDRPKMGFGVPIGDWLRGPLREWAEDLLSPQRLAESGLLNPEPIRDVWHNHVTGKIQDEHRLWCVLMFQAWRAAIIERSPATFQA